MLGSTLLHLPLLAQITVTPGDPAALQAAIDAAPAGATIRIEGGVYDRITIPKALELVAEPAASFVASDLCEGNGTPSLITISGPGAGRVTLQNFELLGDLNGAISCSSLSPIVSAEGLDELWILDCDLTTQWSNLSGSAPSARGLSTTVPTVVVSGSELGAVSAGTDLGAGFPQLPGIDAPQSDVILADSTVTGGSYGLVFTCPGPPFAGGLLTPAPAVVARRLFSTGSVAEAGNTTEWTCNFSTGGFVEFDEPGVQALLDTVIFENLEATTAPLLGLTWDLTADLEGAGGLLFVNSDANGPELLPELGWSFLSLSENLFVEPLGPGGTALSYGVPAAPALVGFELACQLLDLELVQLGGPVIAQIR